MISLNSYIFESREVDSEDIKLAILNAMNKIINKKK